ncbi:ferric reduction oxidase 7 [Quercus suber]|uniref:Ferric reduction oxidase 7 n=1 Tax=Quercus suber TaxID=58331 RepID=A0AAW0KCV6_QUESU
MAVDDIVHTSHPLLHSNVAHANNNNDKKNTNFISLAKWVLKFTMWIVFLAWIALFFVIPTDFGSELYADWIGATNESLFGYTASCKRNNIIFLIMYLLKLEPHKNFVYFRKKTPRFRLWTFPVLVDGPLGVVSAAELIGIILFIVFVIWDVYVYTAVILGTLTDDMDPLDLWYDILLGWLFHHVKTGTSLWYYRIILLGFFVSSGCKGISSSPPYRYPFRASNKISCVAWTSHYAIVYSPWTILCNCMDN